VNLQYGDKVILRDVNAEIKDVERRCHVQGQVVGFLGPSGIGKCLGKGTPVLMFDGSIKNVEDVRVGDLLMGPDSKPRCVLSLGRGIGDLYDVIPVKGDSYRVNGEHILALHLIRSKRSRWGDVEITVVDYLKQSHTFKGRAKGYRVGVSFQSRAVPLDPYFLGLWLGDGSVGASEITTSDKVVVESLQALAVAVGGTLKTYDYHDGRCPRYNVHTNWNRSTSIQSALKRIGVLHRKHVPLLYKANDASVRLSLLAGLIDTSELSVIVCPQCGRDALSPVAAAAFRVDETTSSASFRQFERWR
jgi:replicative DNA helicase